MYILEEISSILWDENDILNFVEEEFILKEILKIFL